MVFDEYGSVGHLYFPYEDETDLICEYKLKNEVCIYFKDLDDIIDFDVKITY